MSRHRKIGLRRHLIECRFTKLKILCPSSPKYATSYYLITGDNCFLVFGNAEIRKLGNFPSQAKLV